jgi:hypothetical protein
MSKINRGPRALLALCALGSAAFAAHGQSPAEGQTPLTAPTRCDAHELFARSGDARPPRGKHLQVENDAFSNWLGFGDSDRWYTSGVKLTQTLDIRDAPSVILCIPRPIAAWANENYTDLQFGFSFGQLMFTPQNIRDPNPQPDDRYWGGFLYFGQIIQGRPKGWNGKAIDSLEIDYGVVGPASLAKQTQKFIHSIESATRPAGWSNQLRAEPAIQATYARQVQLCPPDKGKYFQWDCTAHFGGSVGTVFDYGNAGFGMRFGANLDDAPIGTIENPAIGDLHKSANRWYFMIQGDAKGVLHNAFIDGSLLRNDPYASPLKSKFGVFQATGGIVVEFKDPGAESSGTRLSLLLHKRSAEFNPPSGSKPNFTFATLGIEWDLP